jgi:zinc protease
MLGALGVAACGGAQIASTGPTKVDIPISDGLSRVAKPAGPKGELPPPPGTMKEAPFPSVLRSTLANGMGVDVVPIKSLPIVQLRVLVRAGSGYGSAPGIGELTADMLKDGGTRAMPSAELLRRVESLGSDLTVRSEVDGTVIGMELTKERLSEGLSLLSQVVREPRFDPVELQKLKKRSTDEVDDAARSNGSWTATWLVFRELFPEKTPYAVRSALPSQIAKIDGNQIRDFHRRFYVPKTTTLVLAGDIEEAAGKELAQKHFGSWTGSEPPKVEFAPPKPPEKSRVFVAHRPKSVQSDVFVAMLAPERRSAEWPAIRVANQILGGGVASRLFADVREQRSLAYSTRSQIVELAHGNEPLLVYAGTESSKTSQSVTGLIENIERMKASPPTSSETETARRYLSDIFAIRMETVAAIAEMVVTQETFGLRADYWDTYRKQLRATQENQAADASAKMFSGKNLIVVAGDADVIGGELARFGEVTVVDPEKEFKVLNRIPSKAASNE